MSDSPGKPAPPTPQSLAQPVQQAMRTSPAVKAALARLKPADRAYARKAIADAVAAKLRRQGPAR